MTELKDSKRLMIISSIKREDREKLPSLIIDARENPLVTVYTPEGDIHVRPVAMPYTEIHTLVVPDLSSKEDTPSVATTPEVLLGKTFQVAEDIAEFYGLNPEVQEIDIGFNYSELEVTKHIATQRKTFHIHVVGYTEKDRKNRIARKEALKQPMLKTKMSEPVSGLISELMHDQVLPELHRIQPKFFKDNFQAIEDPRGFTLKMKTGLAVFNNPEFPQFLKLLHTTGQNIYEQISKCFLAYDTNTKTFIEDKDDNDRYELLPLEQRVQNANEYLISHPDLSFASQRILLFLATEAKTTLEILNRTADEQKQKLMRFMAIKNFAYAAVFSGVKNDNNIDWKFGFDPVVFSTRDFLQASRETPKLFERNPNLTYDQEKLVSVKQQEKRLCDHLLEKETNLIYEKGLGYAQLQ